MTDETAAHYFEFSRNFDKETFRRLCGRCGLRYDIGQHIEITTLKAMTHYVCPNDTGLGHSAIYTGANIPENRNLKSHLCMCGAAFVEEEHERWRLSWEMGLDGQWWATEKVASKHATAQQRDGLVALASDGEEIRNIQLERLSA